MSLLQHGLLMGSQPPLGIHVLWCGFFHTLQVDICSTVDLSGLQMDSLPHHGLLHGLQGNLCSGTWSTSSPSFFTDICVCGVVSLTPSWSSLLLQLPLRRVLFLFFIYFYFFFILNHVIAEALPPSLMGSALDSSGSILEPAGIGSV